MAQMTNSEFLSFIKDIGRHLRITTTQSVFLFAVYNEDYSFDIPVSEMLVLIEKGYLKQNRLTKKTSELLETLEKNYNNKEQKVEKVIRNSKFPSLSLESAKVCKHLSKHFIGKEGIPADEFKKYLEYCQNDPIQVPFLWLFTQLFPTRGDKNQNWNKHFQYEWGNIQLRKVSKGWLRKFRDVYNKKDIGTFLLGTYMFIKSSESEGKYFIKSIENYMASDWQHYYEEAEAELKNGDVKKELNKSQSNNRESHHSILI